MLRKSRTDAGAKRVKYNEKVDTRGKTHKENALLNNFWANHKMEDIINLTVKELDAKIAIWIEKYEALQRSRVKHWIWPSYKYDPTPKIKKEKKVNEKFNSSFKNR